METEINGTLVNSLWLEVGLCLMFATAIDG